MRCVLVSGLLVVGLSIPACGRAEAESASRDLTSTVVGGYHGTWVTNGNRLEVIIDPAVEYTVPSGVHVKVVTGEIPHSVQELTVRGRPFDLVDGEVRIGDRGYGPLPSPAKIEIKPGGVWVNGELRGGLER